MKKHPFANSVAAIFTILVASGVFFAPKPSIANEAIPVAPTYIDRSQGFLYFTVYNGWSHSINNLYGWVYGYNRSKKGRIKLVNNPDQVAKKVSLGPHSPGRLALYRFRIPEGFLFFNSYALQIKDGGLFHPDARYPWVVSQY